MKGSSGFKKEAASPTAFHGGKPGIQKPYNFDIEKEQDLLLMQQFGLNWCDNCQGCIFIKSKQPEKCLKAHSIEFVRRNPFESNGMIRYLPQFCVSVKNVKKQQQSSDLCANGEVCYHAHTQAEMDYHPYKYKTFLCPYYQKPGGCLLGRVCHRAHGQDDIRSHALPYFQKLKEPPHVVVDQLEKQSFQVTTQSDVSNSPSSNKNYTTTSHGLNKSPSVMSSNSKGNKSNKKQKIRASERVQKVPEELDSFKGLNRELNIMLDLNVFKVYPCNGQGENGLPHNKKRCMYFHDKWKDRRRPPGIYQAERCQYILNKQDCPFGENCGFSHNRVEEFYHPDKYKAKFCASYFRGQKECEYSDICSFAHSESELTIDLIEHLEQDADFYLFHFKTVWCPYNEDDHSREVCVYAHNWQDYRRKPNLFNYKKEMCSNWTTNDKVTSYKQGCTMTYMCGYSHGWKEQELHPDYYKTNSCNHGTSCQKSHCPYYHSESERRHPLSQWYKLMPKTRGQTQSSNSYLNKMWSTSIMKQTSFTKMTTEIMANIQTMVEADHQFAMQLKQYIQSQIPNSSPMMSMSSMNFQAPQGFQQQAIQNQMFASQSQPMAQLLSEQIPMNYLTPMQNNSSPMLRMSSAQMPMQNLMSQQFNQNMSWQSTGGNMLSTQSQYFAQVPPPPGFRKDSEPFKPQMNTQRIPINPALTEEFSPEIKKQVNKGKSSSNSGGTLANNNLQQSYQIPKIHEKVDQWGSYSFPVDRTGDDTNQQLKFNSMNWVIDEISDKVDETDNDSNYNSEEEQNRNKKTMGMNDMERFLDSIDMHHLIADFKRASITKMEELVKLDEKELEQVVSASQHFEKLKSELHEYGKADDMIASVID